MTKVFVNKSILDYRRDMAETVREIMRAKRITGLKVFSGSTPPLAQPNLLPPPRVEALHLDFYQGQVDDQIMLVTSDEFQIVDVHVMILEEDGTLIESGGAYAFSRAPDCWAYVTEVQVSQGTPVIVYAVVTDGMGGVGASRAHKTI